MKPILTPDMIQALISMHERWGQGNVVGVYLRLHECNSETLCGVVLNDSRGTGYAQDRFFKIEHGHICYLSRKRKYE